MSVAVIMPNYNNGPFLRQCLDSFADDPAVSEIVIYDNASTDDSVAVIEAHPSPKIRLIKGQRNLFATGGRHEAIKATAQPYLSFVGCCLKLGSCVQRLCCRIECQDVSLSSSSRSLIAHSASALHRRGERDASCNEFFNFLQPVSGHQARFDDLDPHAQQISATT